MRRITSIIFLFLLLCNFTTYSQLLSDFETGGTNNIVVNGAGTWYDGNLFNGAPSLVANPDVTGVNKTATCVQAINVKNADWWGNFIFFTPKTPITITQQNRYLKIMCYRTIQPKNFTIGINGTDSQPFVGKLTQDGVWEDVVVDLGVNYLNTKVNFFEMILSNNWDDPRSGWGEAKYLFDQFELSDNSQPRTKSIIDGSGFKLNFEDESETNKWVLKIDNQYLGNTNELTANPFTQSIVNNKGTVLKFDKSSLAFNWQAGPKIELKGAIPVGGTMPGYLHSLVYIPVGQIGSAGVNVMLKATDLNGYSVESIKKINATEAGEWKDFVVDVSPLKYIAEVAVYYRDIQNKANSAQWIANETNGLFNAKTKWITSPTSPSTPNQWLMLRKKITLANAPSEPLIAKIAADSKYWLYINGELVVFEGQLKRGPTPTDTYYDEVDITKYLKQGENTIAALLWYWGKDGYSHKSSGKAGFLFEAQNTQVSLFSDKTWKIHTCDAFSETGDPKPNTRLSESNIRYTSKEKYDGWMLPAYAETNFAATVEVAAAGSAPWNKLWKRPFPQWKNSGIVDYTNTLTYPFVSNGAVIEMNLPVNYTITPYLQIEAPTAGVTIDIRTDNYKGGSEYNVRTEYVTRAGVQEFETFGYMNGHKVQYTIPAGIKVLKLGYRRTSFPTEHIGLFQSDDAFLNSLWRKARNTMDLNMRDAIQDPDRERAQWWGDAVIIMGQILYTCDSMGVKAIKKSMSNLLEWQRPDASIYSPIPGIWVNELPQQSLASIGKYGFWNYYRYTGDKAFVEYAYPKIARYMDLWKLNAQGLVVHRPGLAEKGNGLFWDWTDWGSSIDMHLCENAWYYMALESLSKMATLQGYTADAAKYERQRQVLKEAFNKTFWTGKEYRSPSYYGPTDDRGNGLAVVAGLSDSTQWTSIKTLLDATNFAGPYLEKYILEAYFVMNDATGGINRMKSRYKVMVDSELSTLWEGWGVGSGTYGGGSYNHGWAGGPLTLMSQYIAGVQPKDDGFTSVLIKPQMGSLTTIQCKVPHKLGLITVNLTQSTLGKLHAVIVLPVGLTGTIIWNKQEVQLTQGSQVIDL